MSELPHADRVKRLGVQPGPDDPPFAELVRRAESRKGAPIPRSASVGAPASYDLRNADGKNYVWPVRDQGSCGACVAFASVAAMEGTLRVQRSAPDFEVDLSEAHLFYCHGRSTGQTCDTGWIPDQALTKCRDIGIVDEACYPYIAGDQDCSNLCSDWASGVTRATEFHQIASRSEMKEWLATKGPLTACFVVFDDFFNYTGGVYRHVTGEAAGGHAVAIVGYNDADGCWIVKNSWNDGWGEQGFFRIAYGECEIDTWQVCAVDGIAEPNQQSAATIRGLWVAADTRNAWAYVDALGWRRISNQSDAIMVTMLTDLAAAKAASAGVDLIFDGDTIKQVTVK